MSKITLKLQNLRDGTTSFHEVEDEAAAIAYLQQRPAFTDVLGVAFEGLTREQNARLRAAMRPLDDAEREAEAKLTAAAQRAKAENEALRRMEEEAAMAAYRAAMKNADPNRAMEVRYRYDSGISIIDPTDAREISDECRAAIEAWLAERNEWVESRGQVVGEAKLSVWPGTLPKGATERVHAGSFIPVAAAAKPNS
jgi:hypothetical protein